MLDTLYASKFNQNRIWVNNPKPFLNVNNGGKQTIKKYEQNIYEAVSVLKNEKRIR